MGGLGGGGTRKPMSGLTNSVEMRNGDETCTQGRRLCATGCAGEDAYASLVSRCMHARCSPRQRWPRTGRRVGRVAWSAPPRTHAHNCEHHEFSEQFSSCSRHHGRHGRRAAAHDVLGALTPRGFTYRISSHPTCRRCRLSHTSESICAGLCR